MEESDTVKNEALYSSSDTDDSLVHRTFKKKYTQKFRKSWISDPRLSEWIVECNDREAKCKYCNCVIKSKLSILLSHGKTSKHITAVSHSLTNKENPFDIKEDGLVTSEKYWERKETESHKRNDMSKNEDIYNSSDTEGSLLHDTIKKKYTQKFRKSWISDPRLSKWIVEVNDKEAKCKYCNCVIKSKLSILLSHGKTSKHIEAVSHLLTNKEEHDEFPQNPLAIKQDQSQQKEIGSLEILENEVVSSSSDSEESLLHTTIKKKYRQKFRKSWFSDSRLSKWIVEVNDKEVKCKYCNHIIASKLSSLLRHGKTSKHIRAVANAFINKQNKFESQQVQQEVHRSDTESDSQLPNAPTQRSATSFSDPTVAQWFI